MFGDRFLVAERVEAPLTRALRVGHGLERGEGLRRDDEQRLGRVEVARRLGEVGAIDVGDEAHGEIAIAVVAQRLVGHHRAQVRAADSDVDDVADPLAGMALPRAARARGVQNAAIRSSTACTSGTTFLPSTMIDAPRGARSATCSTARLLRDVDLLAAEHRVDALAQARLVGQLPAAGASSRR